MTKEISFANDLLKDMKDADTFILGDGDGLAEFSDYVDTGSYALNALISGSIYGGVPNTKRVCYASDPGVGKSFMILTAIKNHLDADPTNIAIIYDTETAQTRESLAARGIDVSRVIVSYKQTVEDFRNHLLNFLDRYLKSPEKSRPSCLVALDSLGQLSTLKEVGDTREGNTTRDMTRAQLLKGAFRILTIPLSRAKMPMFIANHVYDSIGAMFAKKNMSGGCLEPSTKIKMADGSVKAIGDICVGELVLTMGGPERVMHVWDKSNLSEPDPDCYEIEFEDGVKIVCSASHKFLVNGSWVEACELNNSMTLTSL